jgi:hypothetical protein
VVGSKRLRKWTTPARHGTASHSSPFERNTMSVTVFWGRPSRVVHCATR